VNFALNACLFPGLKRFSEILTKYKENSQPLIGFLLGFCPWDVANVIVQYQMQAACQVAKFMPIALIVLLFWPQTDKSSSFG